MCSGSSVELWIKPSEGESIGSAVVVHLLIPKPASPWIGRLFHPPLDMAEHDLAKEIYPTSVHILRDNLAIAAFMNHGLM